MRLGGGRLRLLAACCLLLGACETPLGGQVPAQTSNEAAFLPPELAAARAAQAAALPQPVATAAAQPLAAAPSQPVAAAPPQPLAAPLVTASTPAAPRRTGSVNRPEPPPKRLKKSTALARPARAAPPARQRPDPKPEVEPAEPVQRVMPAERGETVQAASLPNIPREEIPVAAPDPAALLPELELRKSLDSGEPASVELAADSSPAAPVEGRDPTVPSRESSGLQPVREPIVGEACECPYDIAPSGQACDGDSEWSTPGGHDPVCYADKWAVGFGKDCPLPPAGEWSGDALPGFCRPG